jgi:hypothetical protein
MRIWDIDPGRLCRNHFLGEHRELHAIWAILTKRRSGYAHHPEVLRWKGKLKALYLRHEELVREFKKRRYNHKSALDLRQATGKAKQDSYVDPPEKQVLILKSKRCGCPV